MCRLWMDMTVALIQSLTTTRLLVGDRVGIKKTSDGAMLLSTGEDFGIAATNVTKVS